MNRVALFDFCETLVNFQTADAYVDYVREKLNDKRMYIMESIQKLLMALKVIQIVEKVTRYRYSINKRIKLLQLKGHSYAQLQELAKDYYQERIIPNLIPEMMNKMSELKNEGYSILLVSGGYDIYLHYFMEEYNLSGIISTRIGFEDNICTGKFDGLDCLREGKTNLLNLFFESKPQLSVAFSDSVTDLPFLKWVNHGYVVSRNSTQKWAIANNLKEIIWTEKQC